MTAALALLLCLVLPGIAGGVLLSWSSDDPTRPGALVLRSVSAGVSAWLLSSGLLERTVGITKTSAWVMEGLLGVASVAVLLLPRSRAVLRSALGEAGYFASLVVVTAVAWLPMGALLTSRRPGVLLGSTPWYYWSLAQQVADAGRVPATATEWGTTLPFLADYRLFSDGTALMLAQGGDFDVRAIAGGGHRVRHAARVRRRLVGQRAGLGAASPRSWLRRWQWQPGSARCASRRTAPKALGLGLSLLMVACFLDWFRRGERASLVAGCLLGVTLANVHGIALLGGSGDAGRGGRGHAFLVAECVGTSSACWARALALLAQRGAGGTGAGRPSGASQVGKLGNRSGLADPTWDFIRAIRGHLPVTSAEQPLPGRRSR